jgi:hypothetical protein
MDTITQMNTLKDGVSGAIMAPNEARKKLDLPPVKGGDSPLAQQQNYSLEALARRDAEGPPTSTLGSAANGSSQSDGAGGDGSSTDGDTAEPPDEGDAPIPSKRLADLFETSLMEALNAA